MPIKNKYTDLMIDLETLDTTGTAALLSIAAVPFNICTGKYSKKDIFYVNINLQSCIDAGLTINGDTFYWWMSQSDDARNEVVSSSSNRINLNHAIYLFNDWSQSHSIGSMRVWGNSARFDLGILENAYLSIGKTKVPWNFTKERDVRTLVSLKPEIKKRAKRYGTAHNPVDDCIFQIRYCSKIWKELY